MAIIHCKVGPEEPNVDGTVYIFRRDHQGRHIAMVNDPQHIKLLLANPVYVEVMDESQDGMEELPPIDPEEQTVLEEVAEPESEAEREARVAADAERERNEAVFAAQEQKRVDDAEERLAANNEDRDPEIKENEEDAEWIEGQMPDVDPTREDAPAAPTQNAVPSKFDDFTVIDGIGPATQNLFNSAGIYTFDQLKNMTEEAVAAFEVENKMVGQFAKNEWQDKAAYCLDMED